MPSPSQEGACIPSARQNFHSCSAWIARSRPGVTISRQFCGVEPPDLAIRREQIGKFSVRLVYKLGGAPGQSAFCHELHEFHEFLSPVFV